MNIIEVHGIRTHGFHGCLKEESIIGGDYIVDIDVWTTFKNAAKNDDLNSTINYVDIKNIVINEMDKPSKLIETVAYRIINSIKNDNPSVIKCLVKVRKINPPIDGDVDYVSVIIKE